MNEHPTPPNAPPAPKPPQPINKSCAFYLPVCDSIGCHKCSIRIDKPARVKREQEQSTCGNVPVPRRESENGRAAWTVRCGVQRHNKYV